MADVETIYDKVKITQSGTVLPAQRALDAENAVLGSLLIDEELAPQLFAAVRADDFIHKQAREVFLAARALFRDGAPVDPVTIRGKLGGNEQSDALSAYLIQLMEITPTSANWKEYAAIMREQSALYRIRVACGDLFGANSLDECRPIIAAISDALQQRQGVRAWTMAQLYDSFLDYQDPENVAVTDYLRYGMPELDSGMFTEPGDVVVIGGYPSDGKTALALSFAWEMSKTRKTGFFSLETDLEKLRDRLITHVAQVSFSQIKTRRLSNADWDKIAASASAFANNQNFIVLQAAGMSAADIQAVSRAYGFAAVFVDYVQLVTPDAERGATRAEQIAVISRSFHTFAQSTKTAVFELAQLTRPDKSGGSPGMPRFRDPNMNDLKESGQLEQDADAVLIVFRPDSADNRRVLKVAKNKEGLIGAWNLDFDGATQTFSVSVNSRVVRSLSAAGRAVKQFNRAMDPEERMRMLENPDDSGLTYQSPF